MKSYLMFRDRNFDLDQRPLPNEADLVQDLALDVMFDAMSAGDKFLRDVASRAVLSSLTDRETILFRQTVLKDCLKNPDAVRKIYKNAAGALESEGKVWNWIQIRSPNIIINRSVEVLFLLLKKLKELRDIVDAQSGGFESEAFKSFFEMVKKELPYQYLTTIQDQLSELQFDQGTLVGADLGNGNKGDDYSLRRLGAAQEKRPGWTSRLSRERPSQYTFYLEEHDEDAEKMLSELREMGVNSTANALAQSADHVLAFFKALRTELGFYLACLNLHELLTKLGEPTSFPVPVDEGGRTISFSGLYDVCLALRVGQRVVSNDLDAAGKDLVVVTGANRGGKSTFLRSVGQAQLLMQCGAFVPASSFSADLRDCLFTHFKREEDPTMKKGKLDEELSRMSSIVDHLSKNGMVLLNESFTATNQREGSEIGGQVVSALLESGVKVFFVTHQYEFARTFFEKRMPNAVFLRAERKAGGERTFKIVPGDPLETSYGEDLYDKIFATPGATPTMPKARTDS